MNVQKHIEEIENMTPEQIAQLEQAVAALPEEQVKEAQAAVDRELLADALYQYGWLQAERQFATCEGDGDLSKVASADVIKTHEEQEALVQENIETLVNELGIEGIEDEVEFAKEAQAAAGLIFNGYTDALEKIAAAKPAMFKKFLGKAKGAMKDLHAKGKDMAAKGMSVAKKHGKKALHAVKKHPGKAMGAAAGLGLAAGAMAHKKMEKKASDMSVEELHEEFARITEIEAGLDKLAAYAAKKGEAAKKNLGC